MFDKTVKRPVNLKEHDLLKNTRVGNPTEKPISYENDINYLLNRDQKVSPLGRTSNGWLLTDHYNDRLFQHNPMQIYKDTNIGGKGALVYSEAFSNRIRWTRKQGKNKDVRISGRRFTTGACKRQIVNDQSSYESNELANNRTSNAQALTKLVDFKPTDLQSSTPDKYSKYPVMKVKSGSSYLKKRSIIHPSVDPYQTYNLNKSSELKSTAMNKVDSTPTQHNSNLQYLKSASLCQFHKKIFILTGNHIRIFSCKIYLWLTRLLILNLALDSLMSGSSILGAGSRKLANRRVLNK